VRRPLAAGAGAGLLVAASLPPWGWWPLGVIGFGVLAWAVRDCDGWRARTALGAGAGVVQFAVGLWWMHEFSAPGYVLCALLEAAFITVAVEATPARRAWALPAALVLAEAVRGHVPFEGLPLGGAALGQARSPLAPAARLGGELLLVGVTVLLGVALAAIARREWTAAIAAGVIGVAIATAGAAAPAGRGAGTLSVAAVQGGGERGVRAIYRDPQQVFDAQLAATTRIRGHPDLIVWPEDVIDVDHLDGSPADGAVADVARARNATVVAGIVEDDGSDHFRNAAVAWAPSGSHVARYDKAHRVPFGEYVPLRGLVEHLGNAAAVPRDARAGHGPGLLRTPAGRLGVVISYEVFFQPRARAAARAGGEVLLVPTNASSFRTSQVPGQELAAARLRALETGLTVVQAAPTGYSAVVDDTGRVADRTRLGVAAVVEHTVARRRGQPPATRLGQGPMVAVAVVLLVLARLERWRFKFPVADSQGPG
jgi:apolipoprotein N-acyltransferase